MNEEIIETADKVQLIIQLMGDLNIESLKRSLEIMEDKESTYGLFHFDNLDVIRNRKKRVKAFLEFRKILEETDETLKSQETQR